MPSKEIEAVIQNDQEASRRIHSMGPGRQKSTRASYGLGGMHVSETEAREILAGFVNQDDTTNKTWSRQFVERFLINKAWYNPPQPHNPEKGDLRLAWSYYEHVTLPRHFTGEMTTDTVMRRAEPGENTGDTELFSPFKTPESSLIEWGVGVDLYFISLRFFAVLMAFAGVVHIKSMIYFASRSYNEGSTETSLDLIKWMLRGSAVCTDTQWVVCTDCKKDQWEDDKGRFGIAEDGKAFLVLRNMCKGVTRETVYANLATLITLLIFVALFSYYLRLREIRFDEDKVTTTDYSIRVKNPPQDAIDPDVWRDFFSQFAEKQVTVVTVALNNETMVGKLIKRRIFRNQLKTYLGKDVDIDDQEAVLVAVDKYMQEKEKEEPGFIGKILNFFVFPPLRLFEMFLLPDVLASKIDTLTKEVKELQNAKYDAAQVFITFETEQGQRNALTALSHSRVDVLTNRKESVAHDTVFQGRVLDVDEPTEPSAVRWLDISTSTAMKLLSRVVTLTLTCAVIAIAAILIKLGRNGIGTWFSALLTSLCNSSIPMFIKILMIFEKHSTEGGFQSSLYFKITIARVFLTAVLSQVITPFTATLGHNKTDLLPTIQAVLFSDVFFTPIMRLGDMVGNLQKHILGPRARNQEEMNLSFQGTFYNLGERYTDFTKVLFVCFAYSAFYPAALFIGAAILAIQYVVDKFCLMRIWSLTPAVGSQVAILSRRYFFTGCLISFAVVSSFAFASFPYDNLCDPLPGTAVPVVQGPYENVKNLFGEPLVTNQSGEPVPVVVSQSTNSVYCDQSVGGYAGFPFPATSRIQSDDRKWAASADSEDLQWMTTEQAALCYVYGWVTVCLVFLFMASFIGRALLGLLSFLVPRYSPEGDDQHIDFSSDPEIFAYVPQIKRNGFPFPFIVCDIDELDQDLMGWNDLNHSYDFHNVIFDLPIPGQRPMIDENPNTISAHQGFRSGTSPTERKTKGSSPGSQGFEASDVKRRPIYSVIKHYPTKWQLELAKKNL